MKIDIQEAQSQLSVIINKVKAGEEILIEENGNVFAKLSPATSPKDPHIEPFDWSLPNEDRKPGGMEGEIWISPDFDAPLPDDIARSLGMID